MEACEKRQQSPVSSGQSWKSGMLESFSEALKKFVTVGLVGLPESRT